jgi:predicted component of type VI protein secretion system
MIEKGDLFLGINSPDNSSNVVRDIPTISKIAGFAVIDSIINSALPGLEIKYQPPPVHLLYRTIPASYRFKESPNGTIDFSSFSPYIDDLLHGFHFFAIKKEGLYWKSVQDCKELGITIPDVFPIEQVKLYSDNSNLIKISELHKEFGADYV